MARDTWDPTQLPDLTGRRYLVTGSTAGLGFFASLQLAGAGAHVIMTGRNPNRLASARAAVRRQVSDASVETLLLDTSNLGSVRAAAATVRGRAGLHGLLLNAGIVHPPKHRETTADGHEIVFATNALGHYALAGELLLPLAAGRGRMVWVGSMSTTLSPYDPIDPELENEYTPWRAYVQSKVATTALGFEADRRLRAASVPVASLIAHPGYAIGGRTRGILGINEPSRAKRFVDNLQAPVTQSKEHGAWPLVRALVDPDAEGGQFWGPSRIVAGPPRLAAASKITRDETIAARLWNYCEHATGGPWPYLKARRTRRRR
ncbi:MAG: dehydrogenase [Microbacterium sp. SCN 70-27]|uniref:SDR family NAD(P)-dependent oxidoreductase n=1 Tax=unclassified Microbacterium TaxID=2609290 RepID=UPI00086BF798|nr:MULTISPECIES: SDR family NAD(P)-dependent oxidoreductase [unclassified Microbacterium]MBN9223211.1 SDR family NAD(P)-dependent oxidoreductase [Microbacterium sp.]ODT29224.1 MAG: dehydrogenase [Microbacterium sp. SCN 70-27]